MAVRTFIGSHEYVAYDMFISIRDEAIFLKVIGIKGGLSIEIKNISLGKRREEVEILRGHKAYT